MVSFGRCAFAILYLTIDFISGIQGDYMKCGDIFNVSPSEKYVIRFQKANSKDKMLHGLDGINKLVISSNSTESLNCRLELLTSVSHRLRAVVHYKPKTRRCEQGYLHIGNDKYRPDVESITSYKFCSEVRGIEIVSRNNFLWIVFDNRIGLDGSSSVYIEAKPHVECNSSMFECSPLQCIQPDRVCDGTSDCQNGLDEYCDQYDNGSPSYEEPCFMCEDKTCISPILPIYHDDNGKPLWYICDGISQCKDGTDERKDMCFRSKSKTLNLWKCKHLKEKADKPSRDVLMWNHHRCDGVQDCLGGEDEQCNQDSTDETTVEPTALAIVVTAVSLVCVGTAVFIYSLGKKQRLHRQTDDSCSPQSDPMESCRLQGLGPVIEEPENISE